MGIETAILGAAVIGAGSSYMASSSASDSADASTAAANAAAQLQYKTSQAQLEFTKQQYDDWKSIFGDVQENLKSYYNNLSPNTVTSLGLQGIEQEYVRSRQSLDTAMAQRGITNSGVNAQALTNLESNRMLGRANVRATADQTVAAQKAGFLQLGMGQQANLQSGINNAYTNQISLLGQQATNAQQQSQVYANQAAQGYAGIGSSIGSGLNTYMAYQNMQSNQALTNSLLGSNSAAAWWKG
jgi:hypothetical protein